MRTHKNRTSRTGRHAGRTHAECALRLLGICCLALLLLLVQAEPRDSGECLQPIPTEVAGAAAAVPAPSVPRPPPLALLVPTSIPARTLPFRELALALVRRGWRVEVLLYDWVATEPKLKHMADLQHNTSSGVHLRWVQRNATAVYARLGELKDLVLTDAGPGTYLPLYASWIRMHAVDMALEVWDTLTAMSPEARDDTLVVADLDQVASALAALRLNVTGVMLTPTLFSGLDRHECRGPASLFDNIVQVSGGPLPLTPARHLLNGFLNLMMATLDVLMLTDAREFVPARVLGFPDSHDVFHYGPCKRPLMPVIAAGALGLGAPLTAQQPWVVLTGPILETDTLAPIEPKLQAWMDRDNVQAAAAAAVPIPSTSAPAVLSRTILYICFGTSVTLTAVRARIIAEAILLLLSHEQMAHVDVLWSLSEDFQKFLPTEQQAWREATGQFGGGDGGDSSSASSLLSARVRVESFTSQKRVLSHARVGAFVTQCGSNSCLEGLYFGKPLLAMGFPNMDQEFNAQRVHEFGAGLALPWSSSPSAAQVNAALRRVLLEFRFGRRARDAAHLLRRSGGAERAVDFLEDLRAIGWSHLIPSIYDAHWSVRWNITVQIMWLLLVDAPLAWIAMRIWRRSRTAALAIAAAIGATVFAVTNATNDQ